MGLIFNFTEREEDGNSIFYFNFRDNKLHETGIEEIILH